tara:strand:+ start:726 stop:2291 length:1566 start_codon:yes stop_codon:yes gene_type:complete
MTIGFDAYVQTACKIILRERIRTFLFEKFLIHADEIFLKKSQGKEFQTMIDGWFDNEPDPSKNANACFKADPEYKDPKSDGQAVVNKALLTYGEIKQQLQQIQQAHHTYHTYYPVKVKSLTRYAAGTHMNNLHPFGTTSATNKGAEARPESYNDYFWSHVTKKEITDAAVHFARYVSRLKNLLAELDDTWVADDILLNEVGGLLSGGSYSFNESLYPQKGLDDINNLFVLTGDAGNTFSSHSSKCNALYLLKNTKLGNVKAWTGDPHSDESNKKNTLHEELLSELDFSDLDTYKRKTRDIENFCNRFDVQFEKKKFEYTGGQPPSVITIFPEYEKGKQYDGKMDKAFNNLRCASYTHGITLTLGNGFLDELQMPFKDSEGKQVNLLKMYEFAALAQANLLELNNNLVSPFINNIAEAKPSDKKDTTKALSAALSAEAKGQLNKLFTEEANLIIEQIETDLTGRDVKLNEEYLKAAVEWVEKNAGSVQQELELFDGNTSVELSIYAEAIDSMLYHVIKEVGV